MLPHDLTAILCHPRRLARDEARLRLALGGVAPRPDALAYDDGPAPPGWDFAPAAYHQWAGFREVLRAARNEGAASVLVVLDDCVFDEGWAAKAEAFHAEALEWDLLLYGADRSEASQAVEVPGGAWMGRNFFLAPALAVSAVLYDELIAAEPAFPLDVDLGRLVQNDQRRRCVALDLCRTRSGYSFVYERIFENARQESPAGGANPAPAPPPGGCRRRRRGPRLHAA